MKMMKMRIKKYFLPCFLSVIAVLCFVLLAPAFADMEKVDEAELARTNASVTGASDKDRIVSVEKGVVSPETWQAGGTNTADAIFSPSVSKETNVVSLNIKGQETLNFMFGGWNSNMTGGITSAKTR
jgi:hypothetical protein